jgi:DHA3 family multidrug efflux protein-like MFS transporter
MKIFLNVAANCLLVTLGNFFVWFAAVFWLYTETQSVLANAVLGGAFMGAMALSSIWFGSIVDHNKKKVAMALSSVATLVLFAAAAAMYFFLPEENLTDLSSPVLWVMLALLLAGVIAGNIRGIALPTVVTLLVPENDRGRANGTAGIIMGLASSGAGLGSGFALAYLGFGWVLALGIAMTLLAMLHLAFIKIPEPEIVHSEDRPKKLDLAGTFKIVRETPGLLALILFTTFNNLLGGVFASLMDPYGLSLVSVQVWGTMWGFLSMGFVIGGLYIAKRGVGAKPLRTLFIVNIATWTSSLLFTIQPWVWLLALGILIWTILMPFIEAIEHTIVQKIVPFERQGRVFGFAQSVEMAASPITAFLVGPIAQFIFVPFMTTGRGVELIGSWFGTGPGRGMALVFILTSLIGLAFTLIALRSRPYKLLARRYEEA